MVWLFWGSGYLSPASVRRRYSHSGFREILNGGAFVPHRFFFCRAAILGGKAAILLFSIRPETVSETASSGRPTSTFTFRDVCRRRARCQCAAGRARHVGGLSATRPVASKVKAGPSCAAIARRDASCGSMRFRTCRRFAESGYAGYEADPLGRGWFVSGQNAERKPSVEITGWFTSRDARPRKNPDESLPPKVLFSGP